jgi:hypothetical protein
LGDDQGELSKGTVRASGRIIFLFFSRAARALKIRQINNAILKVPDGALLR